MQALRGFDRGKGDGCQPQNPTTIQTRAAIAIQASRSPRKALSNAPANARTLSKVAMPAPSAKKTLQVPRAVAIRQRPAISGIGKSPRKTAKCKDDAATDTAALLQFTAWDYTIPAWAGNSVISPLAWSNHAIRLA